MRKAINFDLDTNMLKKYYPGQNYRDAYNELKSFFEKYKFEHRQYSVLYRLIMKGAGIWIIITK